MALHVLVSEGTLMDELGNPIAPSLSAQQTIVLWASPKTSVGAWTTDFTTLAAFSLSDGVQNSSISYDFICAAGAYTMDFTHLVGPNRAIYTISIDGVTVATVDGYAASFNNVGLGGGVGATVTAPTLATVTGIVIGSGSHVLKFTLATKNASSSSYYGCISQAVLTRTG
jgi:hypothetical protein